MSVLIAVTIIGPLFGAAGGLVSRSAKVRDSATILGIGSAAAAAVALLIQVADNGTHVARVGGWQPELGIALVADLFAVLVLPVALVIILVVELFAIGQRRTAWGANPELAGPLLGILLVGPSLADRVMALDLVLVCLMGAIAVDSARRNDTTYLVLLVVIAIIGFTATVAASKFIEHEHSSQPEVIL